MGESRVLTNNRYWLPGKSKPTPDADVFTAAARGPQTDKILQAEEHHQEDLLREKQEARM